MKNADKPIHPLHPNHDAVNSDWEGLTKREHFAAVAMQGILSHVRCSYNEELVVKLAISFADELLKQLDQ